MQYLNFASKELSLKLTETKQQQITWFGSCRVLF